MKPSDITVEVRSPALGRLGQIDIDDIDDLKLVKRFKNVGSWTIKFDADHPMASVLDQPDHGIVVTGPDGIVLMSGNTIEPETSVSTDDPIGVKTIQGVDDMICMADALAWPQPSNSDVATQNVSHDTRTGSVEALMHLYLSANIGPTATVARRVPTLVLGPNLGRGGTVTRRARFDRLGALLSSLGTSGNLGFDIRQNGTQLEFVTYQPEDKSDLIRMDVDNDMLDSVRWGSAAPKATHVIVAGQGQGVDRKFIMVTTPTSLAASAEWGRRIEIFKDRRDTNDDGEMTQEGLDLLSTDGSTISRLEVVPGDLDTMVFPRDWFLGDIVGVHVGDQLITSIVTEVIIGINADGVQIGATIGEPSRDDFETAITEDVQQTQAQVQFLERNAEVPTDSGGGGGGGTTYTPPSTAPDYAANRTRPYNWEKSLYNANADNMRLIQRSVARAFSGGLSRVTFIGDSVTAGVGTTIGVQDAVTKLRKLFQNSGYTCGELVWPWNSASPGDSRINRNGWIAGTQQFVYSTSPDSLAPQTYVSTLPGTVVEIIYSNASGPFTYKIDSASAVTVTSGANTANVMITVTGLANTTHTVVITPTTTTDVLMAAYGVRPASGAIVFSNGGQSGSQASDWALSNWYQPTGVAKATLPDFVFVELGLNDAYTFAIPSATYKASMVSILDMWNAVSIPQILVVSHDLLPDDYPQALYDLADTRNLPLLDLRDRIGDVAAEVDPITVGDHVHFTELGNSVKAKAWAEVLRV